MLKKINKYTLCLYIYLIIICIGLVRTYISQTVETFSMPIDKNIMIDAGHGDWDPGKVAKDGTLEKEINLNISKYLQNYLEQAGGFVITTRTDDNVLGDTKNKDLKARTELSNNEEVDLLVSIHQNSFQNSKVKGAQVFYYEDSEDSKRLALCIQNRLKEVDSNNNRVAKSNNNYYMLKKTSVPAVIVECGFLSNSEENEKLKDKKYQKDIAWAIYLGILDYYNNK